MKKSFKISIRTLVELIMRHGSIDNRYVSSTKAVEGIRGHQKVQSSYGDNYNAEVPLKYTFEFDEVDIEIEGRADGIIIEDTKVIIDEIKTTTRELLIIDEDYNPLHWAQAKCYGYIYCKDNNINNIDIQITYYNIDTSNTRIFKKTFNLEELEDFMFKLVNEYKDWCLYDINWIDIRNNSIKKLKFPFNQYRPGQRDLAVRVYKAIETGNKCFAQAPTGTGKTISTLFPSIKAMGEELTSKIFYLTAKTITREVAENSINIMRKQGLLLKSVTLTAKEKVCKMEECNCNPEYCPYANGYYDRINDALKDILSYCYDFSRNSIDELSEKYMLCPFELSLELSLYADIIICDYNYVFDPRVYLKRFFDIKERDYTFLIDEAHNLIDRARNMYSAQLKEEDFLELKKKYGKKNRRISKTINDILLCYEEIRIDLNIDKREDIIEEELSKNFSDNLVQFIKACDEYLSRNNENNDDLLQLYFDVFAFLGICEYYDDNFVTLYSKESKFVNIKIYCVNPSKIIIDKMSYSKASVIFSATLLPIHFFKEMYGFTEDDYIVNLRSPFKKENRLILIADNISTLYIKRKDTVNDIINYIYSCIMSRKGNYMVFFPSYSYLNLVYKRMQENYPELDLINQETDMSEEDKEDFLLKFNEDNKETHIAFCVLGGHFSEGIDLVRDKLIGVIIVGVGMPQICMEREIIKNYMNDNKQGFNYSYVYPGIIKVLQAAGRCIRSDEDKGIIMLIDSRYSENRYRNLLPIEWNDRIVVRSDKDIKKECEKFWINP